MSQDTSSSHDTHGIGHISPVWQLAFILAVLLLLTIITVMVTWVDLGPINVWAALLIAVIKAGLVGLYFMHLRYDSLYNGMILILALLFVILFISFSLIDTGEYQESLVPPTVAQVPTE